MQLAAGRRQLLGGECMTECLGSWWQAGRQNHGLCMAAHVLSLTLKGQGAGALVTVLGRHKPSWQVPDMQLGEQWATARCSSKCSGFSCSCTASVGSRFEL